MTTVARRAFVRAFSTLTQNLLRQAPAAYTADGVVVLSYNALKTAPQTLQQSIGEAEQAFTVLSITRLILDHREGLWF
jgi:hypothetical protein